MMFCSLNKAEAGTSVSTLQDRCGSGLPAVAVFEKDLDSLLKFYEFDVIYWMVRRTA